MAYNNNNISIEDHQDLLSLLDITKTSEAVNCTIRKNITINNINVLGKYLINDVEPKGEKGNDGTIGDTGTNGLNRSYENADKGYKGDRGLDHKGEKGEPGNISGSSSRGQDGDPGVNASSKKGEKGQKGERGTSTAVNGIGGNSHKGDKGEPGDNTLVGNTGASGDDGGYGATTPFTGTGTRFETDIKWIKVLDEVTYYGWPHTYANCECYCKSNNTNSNGNNRSHIEFTTKNDSGSGNWDYYYKLYCDAYKNSSHKHALWIEHTSQWGFESYTYTARVAYDQSSISFTGQHMCIQSKSNLKLKTGMIVSSDGTYRSLYDTNQYSKLFSRHITDNNTIPNINLNTNKNDTCVFGLISDKYDEKSAINLETNLKNKLISINSLGEGAIWVSNINGNINNGDLITSSDIPGIGMKQDDDIFHNYTVAKATTNCNFNPSYHEVKYSRLLEKTQSFYDSLDNFREDEIIQYTEIDENSNVIYSNVYDTNSNIVYDWEYKLKYVSIDGTILDKETYDTKVKLNEKVYKMAFIGCTYHCG